MILSFKKQFVDKILLGQKIHTIREDKFNRWHTERKIHFATGIRTKNYNCFTTGVCTAVHDIEIKGTNIIIDKVTLMQDNKELLAKRDGFDSLDEFRDWFGDSFKGKIIYWELKKQ